MVILALIGCSSSPPSSFSRLDLSALQTFQSKSSLGVGDVIEVRVYEEEDLTGTYQISPRGTFSFPLIGEIKARGMTPSSLSHEITQRLKQGYLKRPQVSIFIKESNSKKIFLLGKVKKPGSYTYEEGMRIVQVIALAGGLLSIASSDLILIRQDPKSKIEKRYQIPFKAISLGKAKNIALSPGDIVYIPESWL
jgi:polysaccharide export outer membrane protein